MRTLFYMVLAVVLFVSCEDENAGANLEEQQMGQLTLRLTDAPFPFDLVAEANVTIFKVEAKLQDDDDDDDEEEDESSEDSSDDMDSTDDSDSTDDDSMDDEDEDEDEDSSFVVLMEEEVRVNLLELTNGTTQQLADLEVPAGRYKEIRVFVKDAEVVLTDGSTFDLSVPSGSSSGIKLKLSPAVVVDGAIPTDLLLDFDVSRSFVPQGNSMTLEGITGFIFKPVIKVSVDRETGSLLGKVATLAGEAEVPVHGAEITIIAGDTINTTAFSDLDGSYKIMGLSPGMYKALAAKEGYVTSDSLSFSISEQSNTELNFLLETVQE